MIIVNQKMSIKGISPIPINIFINVFNTIFFFVILKIFFSLNFNFDINIYLLILIPSVCYSFALLSQLIAIPKIGQSYTALFLYLEPVVGVLGAVFLLKENLEVTISFMEDKPISIELPNIIECTIETTDAAIKNQTASSSYKPALLDCGIKINVPPFIESGEKIIIDTRTLEYVKRVN